MKHLCNWNFTHRSKFLGFKLINEYYMSFSSSQNPGPLLTLLVCLKPNFMIFELLESFFKTKDQSKPLLYSSWSYLETVLNLKIVFDPTWRYSML